MRDGSRALAALLRRADVEVEQHETPGVLHAFVHFARMMPEARDALALGARFLRAHGIAAPDAALDAGEAETTGN